MPLYEYTCASCLCEFSRLKSISHMNDKTSCPECGTPSQRQISLFVSFSTNLDGKTKTVGGGCCGGSGGTGCACSTVV